METSNVTDDKKHQREAEIRQAMEVLKKKRSELCDMLKKLGNECYNKGQFGEAIDTYTGLIEKYPRDAEAYYDRALCYTSIGALTEGLKDADKCLELDPTFIRAYLQKGNIEFEKKEYSKALGTYAMGLQHDKQNKELHDAISRTSYLQKGNIEFEKKEYIKALRTYEMGLQHDKQNKELHDAISKCLEQIIPAADESTVMQSHERSSETQAKALLDPEIQAILHDPIMRQVILDFQRNSSNAREHAENKLVVQKLKKLLDADLL